MGPTVQDILNQPPSGHPVLTPPALVNDGLSNVDLDSLSVPLEKIKAENEPNNMMGGIDLDKIADGDLTEGAKLKPAEIKKIEAMTSAPPLDESGSLLGDIWDTAKDTGGKYIRPATAGAIEGAGGIADSILRPALSPLNVLYQMANGKNFQQAIGDPVSPVSRYAATPLANSISPLNQETTGQQYARAGVSGATGGAFFGVPGSGALVSLAQKASQQMGASPGTQLGVSLAVGAAPALLGGMGTATGLSNFTRAGQEAAVGSRLRTLAENPETAIQNIQQNSQSPIEGYQRTTGVASQDPGLLAAQSRLEKMNPAAFSTLNDENNQALNRAVEGQAGTPATLHNAIDERNNTTGPMRETAFANYNNDPRLPSTQYQQFKADVQDAFSNIGDVDSSTKAGQKQIADLLQNYGYEVSGKGSNSGKSNIFTATKQDPITGENVSFQYRTGQRPIPANARQGDYIDLANEGEGMDALAAKVARSEPTKPAVNMNYPQGVISRTLESPEGNTPQVQKSMGAATKTLAEATNPSNPEYAYPLKKAMQSNAQDLLDPTGMNPGAKRLAGGLLKPVMNSLDTQIEKAAPGYADYLAKYHEMSKPIDQMEMLQEASQQSRAPSISGTPPLEAGKWNSYFTKNMKDAKNTLTSPQMQMVVEVGDELDKGAAMDKVSPISKEDVSNLTTGNILGWLSSGTIRMAAGVGGWAHSGGVWGAGIAAAMKGLKFVADMPENSARELLLEAAKDPELGARLMQNPTAVNLSATSGKLQGLAKKMGYGAFVGGAVGANNISTQQGETK